MTLKEPFKIAPRLLPCLEVEGATLSLEFVGCAENRMVFRWYVDLPDGQGFSGADLRSGAQGATTQQMFGTFLAFLGACAESYRWWMGKGMGPDDKPENLDLFPEPVAEWAYGADDELGMLRCQIEESGEVLIEDE